MEKMENTEFSGFNILTDDVLVPPVVENKDPEKKEEPSDNEGDKKDIKEDSGIPFKNKSPEELEKETKDEEPEKKEPEKKEETEDKTKKEETNEDDSPIKVFADFLDEKGIIELDDDFEPTEEGLEKAITSKIEKGISSYKENLGDMSNKFIEFVENGGDPRNFISLYSAPDYSKINTEAIEEDDKLQRDIVVEYLQSQGYSPEEIQEEIDDYEDGGLMEAQAKRSLKRLVKLQAAQREQLVEQQKIQAARQQEEQQIFLENLKEDIFNREDIAGIEIKNKDKEKFFNYITKVNPKTGKTKLLEDSEDDKESRLKMAWFYYNKFDFNKIMTKAKKEVTSSLKESLSRAGSNGSKTRQKSVSHPDDSSFKSFGNLI